jgi:NAD(P)-dependent dehydrogenase (short-subunit alcohol dehydrogenase family)
VGLLDGRVAIVTGAGDGIGRGIARHFAHEGAKVLVVDINADTAAAVADEINGEIGGQAVARVVDVKQKDQVQAMVAAAVETWGTVDILVNNAWGGPSFGPIATKTDDQIAHGFDLAYKGPLWAMQAAFPHMKAQGWGRVVNMCSGAGVSGQLGTVEYNSAKEALRALTETAAREWAPYGIVCNAIYPGAKGSGVRRRFEADPDLEAQLGAANPTGRVGDPETDIAPVAAFLASDGCRYLTANTLFVDGGAHLGAGWQPAKWAEEHDA